MKELHLTFMLLTCMILPSLAQTTNFGENAGNGGYYNTSIGYYAGDSTVGAYNVFIGDYTGRINSGIMNTFTGHSSGTHNENTSGNSFYGAMSGESNTTGFYNTFIGLNSGRHGTTGYYNTFLGSYTGYNNTTGNRNVYIGTESGYQSNTGSQNTYVGNRSGRLSYQGSRNTLVGYEAGYYGGGEQLNVSLGYRAGYHLSFGSYNTFVGPEAGYNTGNRTYSRYNSFFGYRSGYYSDGTENTAVGAWSGENNVDGTQNTFLGVRAGQQSTGSKNVFIGYGAGQTEAGSNKLIIDNKTWGSPLIYGDFTNRRLGIGTSSLGSFALSIYGDTYTTGIFVSSDKRLKKNEEYLKNALDKLSSLKGFYYEYKTGGDLKDRNFRAGKTIGLMAQDVQKTFPELVVEDAEGYLAVNYQGLIPVIIEALKELDNKESTISDYEKQLKELTARVSILESQLVHAKISGVQQTGTAAALYQNNPNPFDGTTTIRYHLPDLTTDAELFVFTLNGEEVLHFDRLPAGDSHVTITPGQLSPGLYHYVLLVAGTVVDSKKMVVKQ